jgi:hypothetical protein
MKKALLLFGITGCFCTDVATKPITVSGRVSDLWSGIQSGAITEIQEHHLEGLSHDQREVTLDALIEYIIKSPSPHSLAMNYLIDQMRVQVDSLKVSRILWIEVMQMVIITFVIGTLYVYFPKLMKPASAIHIIR